MDNNYNRFRTDINNHMNRMNNPMFNQNMIGNNNMDINPYTDANLQRKIGNYNNNNNINNNFMNNFNESNFQNNNNDSNFNMYYGEPGDNINKNSENNIDSNNDELSLDNNEKYDSTGKVISEIFPDYNSNKEEEKIIQNGGFTEEEVDSIKTICSTSFIVQKPEDQKTVDKISQLLKQKYKGEWFVLSCKKSSKKRIQDFDFTFTNIMKEKTLIFSRNDVLFYICKL